MLHRASPFLLPTLVVLGCGGKRETITPAMGPITESVYASGVVKAAGQYQVYPSVSGPVLALFVHEGDTVRAGAALLRIDDRSSSAGQRIAMAQLQLLERNASESGPVLTRLRESVAQARDLYQQDSTDLERQRVLWQQQIGSKAELEQRELAFRSSKAAWITASKSLAESRDRLRTDLAVARDNAAISNAGNDDRTPTSLIDGVVYDLMVEPGEMVTPQKPIAVVGSADDLYLELEVDERDIAAIVPGQRAYVTLELYPQAFAATITRIVPLMDPRSRTFRVEARFTERPPRLFPNITAEASIELRRKDRAMTIPASFLADSNHVLTSAETRTPVELGLRDLERVEIVGGIDSTTVLYRP